ncbi:glycoside hydrolase, partial [Schizophyllum fasciatum]
WNDNYCGGGVWWSSAHDYKNTVTNGLFMHLSAALYIRTRNSDYLDNAKKTWNWLKNSGLRRSDGLWLDGARQSGNSCNLDTSSPWTYNQGIVVSGLGVLYTATGDASYLTEAEKTIDAVVAAMSQGGILKEACDDASNNKCNSDQQLFKGVFMKHLQYYLDQANDKARTAKYSQWISAQASGIYHYAIGSKGEPGSVWYAADAGGSQFTVPAALSGLMGLIAAAK